ncbi:predicted protein [Scheffersomyces stipitis CBS 6054]|uniref:CST complex subunit Stn1 N-terminal domain-containing protein n=1 Tax=Scheffersomyces stipitis (strain ATCC 58785 / CBS 6054 / NBRC 10063 / NRRL Y-11545) TaxID=322104 RepID=A3LTS3_PICST|nr:predicted protein [Scheffersomyces stipitis CBS 6054]ABN66466.2 predicted protein [Scheffersomyces stipitis CBS 6054]
MNPVIDIAPGQNHIALRRHGVTYYVPEVFHHAPTINVTVPILTKDIENSVKLSSIYGGGARNIHSTMMIHNYPINRVKIVGRITGSRYIEKSDGTDDSRNFTLFTIDDSSSAKQSSINVKVFQKKCVELSLTYDSNWYAKIVEVEGPISYWKRYGYQIDADVVKVVGQPSDIHLELAFWSEALAYRNNMFQYPWVYMPPNHQEATFALPQRFEYCELERRNARKELCVTESLDLPTFNGEDSMLIHKKMTHSSDRKEFIEIDGVVIIDDDQSISPREVMDIDSDEIEIVKVHENPMPIVSQFQLMMEMVKYIIGRSFQTFKLYKLFKDNNISSLLDQLTELELASSPLATLESVNDVKSRRRIIFHKVRHKLQVDFLLIKVSRSQNVHSKNLKLLFYDIDDTLRAIKEESIHNYRSQPLDVAQYTHNFATSKNLGDISQELVNGIISIILSNYLHEDNNWKYNRRLAQWTYINLHREL